MPDTGVFIEFLDDGTVEATTVESTGAIELYVEAQFEAVSLDVIEYLEFDDGRGPTGKSAYQTAVDEGFVGTEAAWLASLQGADGVPGDDGAPGAPGDDGLNNFIVQVGGSYPARPVGTGAVFTFVGTADPTSVMQVGDIWINPSSTPSSVALSASLIDTAGDLLVGSADNTAVRLPVTGVAGRVLTEDPADSKKMKWATPAINRDTLWTPQTGHVSVDEFNDGVIDPAWLFVNHASIPGAALPLYAESGDVMSVKYGVATGLETVTSDGASQRHAAMIRPLSGIGGSMANGDAFETAFDVWIRNHANYRMTGLVLSNGTSTGTALYFRWWTEGNLGLRSLTDWGGDTTVGPTDTTWRLGVMYIRIVRISSTTWRGDVSGDGVRWIHGASLATLSFEPTHVGFCDSQWGSALPSITTYEFLRRVSGVS